MTDTTTLPPLPDLSGSSQLWLAIVAWGDIENRSPRPEAQKIDEIVADMLRAYARAALAQSAQPALDPEPLIRACTPGGSICDPQQVADAIRRYLGQWPQEQSAQAPAPEPVATVTLGGIDNGEFDHCDVEWHGEFADLDAMQERYVTCAPVRIPLYTQAPAPLMLNGLTEDETNATASVAGLSPAPAQPAPSEDMNAIIARHFPDDPANAVRAHAALCEILAQPAPSVEAVMELARGFASFGIDYHATGDEHWAKKAASAEAALRSAVEALARGAK